MIRKALALARLAFWLAVYAATMALARATGHH